MTVTEPGPKIDAELVAMTSESVRRLSKLLHMGKARIDDAHPNPGVGWPVAGDPDAPSGQCITFRVDPEIPATFQWRRQRRTGEAPSEHRGRITHIRIAENGVWCRISNPVPAINDGRTNPAIVRLGELTHIEQAL